MNSTQHLSKTAAPAPGVLTTPFDLAGTAIRTPQEFAARVREVQKIAHLISPAIAVSVIHPSFIVNTAIVAIDTTLPPVKYGAALGPDVYFSTSMHAHDRKGYGDDAIVTPFEVSLRKEALDRILRAAAVNTGRSARTDDATERNYCAWIVEGTVVDFDGRTVQLNPGVADLDYRDGAAGIGEWTPEAWAKRVAEADARKAKVEERERWKIKPEPIGGWSRERVINARRFMLRAVATEASNRFARNLGVHQKYAVVDLQKKPFLCFRAMFMPDMSNQRINEMVTASYLGASHMLGLSPHRPDVIDIRAEGPAVTPVTVLPEDAEAFDDLPAPPPPVQPRPVFHLVSSSRLKVDEIDHYFFAAVEGPAFVTVDLQTARELLDMRKTSVGVHIEAEPLVIRGREYGHVMEWSPEGESSRLPDSLKAGR